MIKKKTVYEWFLVVAGNGSFPFDMLRYDSAFPHEQQDSTKLEHYQQGRRAVVLVRRGVNQTPCSEARWKSFGWEVLGYYEDSSEARGHAEQADRVSP